MKDEHFDRLVGELSGQVEKVRVKEGKDLAKEARRDRLRQCGVSLLAVLIGVYVYINYAEINGQVTKLFANKEPEYRGIMKIADEVNSEKPDAETTGPVDPNSRKGKLKDAMLKAKNHAAMVDEIMDYTPEAEKPAAAPAVVAASNTVKTADAPVVVIIPVAKKQ